jgi:hypothetical protein
MPRPRKNAALASIEASALKNPQRFRKRQEPAVIDPLGDPPVWLTPPESDAWQDMRARMPWLKRSHRGIVGIAANLSARHQSGTLGVPGMNLLRIVLGQLCATPVTAGKAVIPAADERDELLD